MDLDSALDDIIKKRKQTNRQQTQKKGQKQQAKPAKGNGRQQPNKATNSSATTNKKINRSNAGNGRRNGGQPQQQQRGGANLGVSSKSKAKISKPTQRNASNINSRLRGGIQTKSKQQQQQPSQRKIDPASIVITKNVKRSGSAPQQEQMPVFRAGVSAQINSNLATHRGMLIRGAAYGNSVTEGFGTGAAGLSIRGESGPASVLISNLDPGANAEDIRMICSQFGQVSHCEVLIDRTGRSLGEAEVEFAQRNAALDCIAKLDNEVADGRILRAVLRSRPSGMVSSSNYMNQTVRSVIAPTRSGFTSA